MLLGGGIKVVKKLIQNDSELEEVNLFRWNF